MHMRISYMFAALLIASGVVFSGGCTRTYMLEMSDADICFGAGVIALDEGTKGVLDANLIESTTFTNPSTIAVSAWHKNGAEQIFDNQAVSYDGTDWSYTPKKKWHWAEATDYYDFLAVAVRDKISIDQPTPSGKVRPVSNVSDNVLSLSVPYDAISAQYDLLMAGTRRRARNNADPSYDPSETVQLTFRHALCAVKVKFIKDAGSADFSVNSFAFKDLLVSGTVSAAVTGTPAYFTFSLSGESRDKSASGRFGADWDPAKSSGTDFTAGVYDPGFYDLLLPQDLDPSGDSPELIVKVTDGASTQRTYDLTLKDIPVKNSTECITRWEPGRKYVYEIHVLYGGGVQVNVTTTPWETVYAHTPGLII